MFWHNKLEETTDHNHQGYVPPRLDRELHFVGSNRNLVVGVTRTWRIVVGNEFNHIFKWLDMDFNLENSYF